MVGRGWTWDREARIWIFAMSFPSCDLGHIPKPLWTLISLSSSNTNMSAGVSREAQSESVQSISLLPASRVLSISFYFLYTNRQRHLAPQGSPWLCSVYQILELPGLWKQSIRWNELAKMASVPDTAVGQAPQPWSRADAGLTLSVVYKLITSILQTRKSRLLNVACPRSHSKLPAFCCHVSQ